MVKVNQKIKFLLLSTATILSVALFDVDYNYEPDYQIVDEDYYGTYPLGKIYIGNEDYLKTVDATYYDVLILDERCEKENMKIISSYKINNRDLQNDILNVMLDYEKSYPSVWDRSLESLRVEWYIHNMLYNINYKEYRTKDVDFENNEEELYDNVILKKIFKL